MNLPAPDFSLAGRVAIVTGGMGILGLRFVRGLAAQGADVAVFDVATVATAAAEKLPALAEECGRRIEFFACDVSDPASVQTAVNAVVARLGRIDVLMNNAATKTDDLTALFDRFEDYTLAQWRKVMAVNLDGMFLMAQAVGRQLIKQGQGGSVIQTASIYGSLAPDMRIYEGSHYLGREISSPAVYSASKAGVIGLTKYLAAYWAPHRIRVNTLTPGGVASGQNEAFTQKYSARIPLRRMAEPDEMVGAAVFLASNASSYVTGHNLIVDGGLHAW
jgi:NAD(P)-dependent dehydrogenase (short-subunit alcohol dehydrogenase family)